MIQLQEHGRDVGFYAKYFLTISYGKKKLLKKNHQQPSNQYLIVSG
jgi:hypothetical protein